jgi:hypothetical protein
VLELLLRGQSNKHIARELNVSVETIKEHVTAVLRSLGVSSRTQAVLAIRRLRDRGRGAGTLTPDATAPADSGAVEEPGGSFADVAWPRAA